MPIVDLSKYALQPRRTRATPAERSVHSGLLPSPGTAGWSVQVTQIFSSQCRVELYILKDVAPKPLVLAMVACSQSGGPKHPDPQAYGQTLHGFLIRIRDDDRDLQPFFLQVGQEIRMQNHPSGKGIRDDPADVDTHDSTHASSG